MVITCHILAYSHPWYIETIPGIVWRLKQMGTQGVQVFFCISGFVICRGLMLEYERKETVTLKAFYVRRFFRIIPPLFLYLSCVAALSIFGILQVGWTDFVQSAMFLCNFADCGWALGHTWSLAYEEQFYIVFPLIFVSLMRFRKRRQLLIFTLALAVVSVATDSFWHPFAKYMSMFVYMLGGCLFALYWNEVYIKLTRMPFPVWLLGCILIPIPNFFALPAGVHHFVVTVILPPIMCSVVFGTPVWRPAVGKLFQNGPITYVGKISFTIYLWQQLATDNYGFYSPLIAFGLLLAVMGFAHLSYRYFEVPLMAIGARIAKSTPLTFAAKDSELPPGVRYDALDKDGGIALGGPPESIGTIRVE